MITTFGEIMLRISPENSSSRIAESEKFEVRSGGSEANVVVALANLGEKCAFVSCLPLNKLGDKIIRELRSENVSTEFMIRNNERLGIYWTETGLGPRNSTVIYDREYSGFSKLKFEDFYWDDIIGKSNWFHFSGISPAVSESVFTLLEKIVEKFSITYSVDLNFRQKLWNWVEKDPLRIASCMKKLCSKAILITGNETDFQNSFGLKGMNVDNPDEYYKEIAIQCFNTFPKLRYIAFSYRNSVSATNNNWKGYMFVRKQNISIFSSREYHLDCIADRVGTGDSFTAGIIYGLVNYAANSYQQLLDHAVTLGSLNHTVKGDFSRFSNEDVLNAIQSGGKGNIIR